MSPISGRNVVKTLKKIYNFLFLTKFAFLKFCISLVSTYQHVISFLPLFVFAFAFLAYAMIILDNIAYVKNLPG